MHTIRLNDQDIPAGKIICVARNYAAHARELGNPVPDQAVLFMKPASSILPSGGTIVIPPYSNECHFEIELAVLIERTGKEVAEATALDYVAGYGVAIDLTLRDVQNAQKEKGLPWEIAKGFDTACPLSEFTPADRVTDVQQLRLQLKLNGELRQDGTTADMLRPVARLVSEASHYFTLERGDVILTGTPAGVGQLKSGDLIEATIDQLGRLDVTVA
jgi:5-carboxymethyl-2-hydroxymuconate isomerase